jgi:hypothetical protein
VLHRFGQLGSGHALASFGIVGCRRGAEQLAGLLDGADVLAVAVPEEALALALPPVGGQVQVAKRELDLDLDKPGFIGAPEMCRAFSRSASGPCSA